MGRVHRDAHGEGKRRLAQRPAIAAKAALARAHHRARHPARIDLADTKIPRIRNVQIARWRHGHVVHAVEGRRLSRTAVALVAFTTVPRDGGKNIFRRQLVHAASGQFHDEHVALRIEIHAKRLLQRIGPCGHRTAFAWVPAPID